MNRKSQYVHKSSSPEAWDKRSHFDFSALLKVFNLQDILSVRFHSEDFIATRSEYIAVRVRFMAFFYAIVVPLWIPADYLLLRPEHFGLMIIPKLLLTACLLPLGLLCQRRLTNLQVHLVFALTLLAAGLFYFASMWILNQGESEPVLAGYSFMPLMFVSMLGVVPLTLDWGVILIAMTMGIYLLLKASLGQLLNWDTANMMWILSILGGIALWVQSSQLLMLLKLYREATRDPLTGLINRRVLMKRLAMEMEHANGHGSSFCILMFDLDRFKRINDHYGHLAGDQVLKTTAEILQRELSKQDIAARFGGEEFIAVLTDCRSEEAVAVAERIRACCGEISIAIANGGDIRFSTSIGVTEYEAGETVDTMLNRVDEALYAAKEMGRNRVIRSQSPALADG